MLRNVCIILYKSTRLRLQEMRHFNDLAFWYLVIRFPPSNALAASTRLVQSVPAESGRGRMGLAGWRQVPFIRRQLLSGITRGDSLEENEGYDSVQQLLLLCIYYVPYINPWDRWNRPQRHPFVDVFISTRTWPLPGVFTRIAITRYTKFTTYTSQNNGHFLQAISDLSLFDVLYF